MRPWLVALKSLLGTAGRRSPRTPIRWLCLRAFCYLGAVSGRELEANVQDALCQAMDLGVYLNRCLDRKGSFCPRRYRKMRLGLPDEPLRVYLGDLRRAERDRPQPEEEWALVYAYRRRVLDLSLTFLFRLAQLPFNEALPPLVSQVQLVDDILDHRLDRALELPTFVTARGPAPADQAVALWAELKARGRSEDQPFVATGFVVYFLARLLIRICL